MRICRRVSGLHSVKNSQENNRQVTAILREKYGSHEGVLEEGMILCLESEWSALQTREKRWRAKGTGSSDGSTVTVVLG
jgi:hypothetical protein